mmetsp:Transcript_25891/g.60324  ORF Transcript_25891/g.60324 Transcript_25891/m.60324 type:complete len:234 (-) Transcript_25891:469-1170(-)
MNCSESWQQRTSLVLLARDVAPLAPPWSCLLTRRRRATQQLQHRCHHAAALPPLPRQPVLPARVVFPWGTRGKRWVRGGVLPLLWSSLVMPHKVLLVDGALQLASPRRARRVASSPPSSPSACQFPRALGRGTAHTVRLAATCWLCRGLPWSCQGCWPNSLLQSRFRAGIRAGIRPQIKTSSCSEFGLRTQFSMLRTVHTGTRSRQLHLHRSLGSHQESGEAHPWADRRKAWL